MQCFPTGVLQQAGLLWTSTSDTDTVEMQTLLFSQETFERVKVEEGILALPTFQHESPHLDVELLPTPSLQPIWLEDTLIYISA